MKDEFVGKRVFDVVTLSPELLAGWTICIAEVFAREYGECPSDKEKKKAEMSLLETLLKRLAKEDFAKEQK